jgi:ATP phosphoribosyltransferase
MITLAIPSKGRLMEATAETLAKGGLVIERVGSDRGYRGILKGVEGVEIAFQSASEIAANLRNGKIDAGVTGEDLLREHLSADLGDVTLAHKFDFGPANVIVAVPECWLDVATMADLDAVAIELYANHARRLRVATKYKNLTRRFFAAKGVTGYRIVESAGATEGAPAAGSADIIVDITTTGNTLTANHLRILDDGLILESRAVLAIRKTALNFVQIDKVLSAISTI